LSKDIPKLLEANGLRGKKFTKAIDNFSYNLALLHGQTDLLNKAKQDANVTIRQVKIKYCLTYIYIYLIDDIFL
jgi:hypothetical protein